MNNLSKYEALKEYLVSSNKDYITLYFEEIENILGFILPKSYKKYRQIWSNSPKGKLSKIFLPIGYKTYNVDIKNGIVNFRKKDCERPKRVKKPKEDNLKEVILLNKVFLSDQNTKNEVINFLVTDNNEIYSFLLPFGSLDNLVHINKNFKISAKPQYFSRFLVLTSNKNNGFFDILYIIRLKEKLHKFHNIKDKNDPKFSKYQEKIKSLIIENNIKYNDTYLFDLFTEQDTLFVTFKSCAIYKAINPIRIDFKDYNYQNNSGYLFEDKNNEDYLKLINAIVLSLSNGDFELFKPFKLNENILDELNEKLSFKLSMTAHYDELLKEEIKSLIK